MAARQITSNGEKITGNGAARYEKYPTVELLCHSDYGRAVARAGFDVDDCDEAPTKPIYSDSHVVMEVIS